MKHAHVKVMVEAARVAQDYTIDQDFNLSQHVDFFTTSEQVFAEALCEETPLHVSAYKSPLSSELTISATFKSNDQTRPFINLTLRK